LSGRGGGNGASRFMLQKPDVITSPNEPSGSLGLGLDEDFKPFGPNTDEHLIFPYNITPSSNIQVTRVRAMITKSKMSCSFQLYRE